MLDGVINVILQSPEYRAVVPMPSTTTPLPPDDPRKGSAPPPLVKTRSDMWVLGVVAGLLLFVVVLTVLITDESPPHK